MGRHHQLADQVASTIASFEHLISTDAPASFDELGKARIVLVQSVNAYIAHFGTIVAAEDRTIPSFWREAYRSVVDLRATYSAHIGRFSASAIKHDWPAYRRGCTDLMLGMRQHLKAVSSWQPID